ncbi:hypothetical protein HH310_12605 [Actinoplanes sp. TBRC 11911]|uniref:hypothetical protein n=1 Tax=Actinoplanes sp. TBRC 11911 TaxID=2729386 RepID=UPI00145EF6F4|nr:hypothetical protein [Actinoplanes sp. TBRC 11911]NMO52034.1 hypothetical protein [Actinoplanes sp. TBRC 11911]
MAFPQTVLPVRVKLALGGSPKADPATWVWTDITQWVRTASAIEITAGRSDEGSKVDPGKCTLTIDNRDGRFSTRNILGAWYGQIRKGTPLRVGTISGAATWTAAAASTWGTPETGGPWTLEGGGWSASAGMGRVSFTGAGFAQSAILTGASCSDGDATFVVSSPVIATGASLRYGLQVRYTDSSDHLHVRCELDLSGAVKGIIGRQSGGTLTDLASATTAFTYSANERIKVRVQWDGPAIRLRIWEEASPEPTTWTVTANDTVCQGSGVGLRPWRPAANTNAGTVIMSFDDLEIEAIEHTGVVWEWPPRWDKSRKDATATITSSGILRRLQQGKTPLRSPITRMVLRNSPWAFWALEDESEAKSAASALPRGTAAGANNVEFGQNSPVLPGALQTVGMTASTVLAASFLPMGTPTVWAVVWFAQLLAPPAARTTIMKVTSTGTVRTWTFDLDATGMYLTGVDADGNTVISAINSYAAQITPPRWIAYDLIVTQVGGTIDAKLLIAGIDVTISGGFFMSDTATGTIGAPTGWRAEGSLGFNGGRMASVAAYNHEPPFIDAEFINAANGYVGELAAARVKRLCAEQGVQLVVEPGDSEPLGAQRVDTFLNLLYAAEAADLGILYERGAGLGYRPRYARYNRAVELALDFAPGDVAEPPEPTDDDQQLRNSWTITRDGGSSAVAQDDASIEAVDLLDDSATVAIATDDRLPDWANWRLKTTTVDEYRWPLIVLQLARNTGQIPLWRAAKPFPRTTIANEPSQVAGNAVDITALGHTQRLEPYSWTVELNCAPTGPWGEVGVYEKSRWNPRTTTLKTGVTNSAISLIFRTTNLAITWSTNTPYDVVIAGERLTVTAMGTASLVSGANEQTATVTRGTVSKPLPAGAEIRIAARQRYGL